MNNEENWAFINLSDEDIEYLLEIMGMHFAVQVIKNDEKAINKAQKLIEKIALQLNEQDKIDIFQKVFKTIEKKVSNE
jgi:hypothetical protein